MKEEKIKMEYYDNNYLAHYGIKGMKCGVRRSQAQLDREHSIRTDLKTAKQNLTRANSEVAKNTRFGRNLRKTGRDKAERAHQDAKKYSEEVAILRERQKINKKINNFGANQNAVLSSRNGALAKDRVHADKWSAAFKAGKGSKEWAAWENYVKDFNEKYKSQYVSAWMKDNNVKKISEQGRKFLEDNLSF